MTLSTSVLNAVILTSLSLRVERNRRSMSSFCGSMASRQRCPSSDEFSLDTSASVEDDDDDDDFPDDVAALVTMS